MQCAAAGEGSSLVLVRLRPRSHFIGVRIGGYMARFNALPEAIFDALCRWCTPLWSGVLPACLYLTYMPLFSGQHQSTYHGNGRSSDHGSGALPAGWNNRKSGFEPDVA
jgi:hypothetical protein